MVCGEGLEINCLTDLVLELNTRELLLINTVFDEMQSAAKYVIFPRIFSLHFLIHFIPISATYTIANRALPPNQYHRIIE